MAEWKRGELLAEGKTKQVFAVDGSPNLAILRSKDDITAGDGAKHDVLPGKGAAANQTTCNVFQLLKACGVPVAFQEQVDDTSFLAQNCRMLPFEVVVRREAHGSFLQRHPHVGKGTIFNQLVCEFYLKTAGRKWRDKYDLVCDDPLMEVDPDCVGDRVRLYNPHKQYIGQEPFLKLPFGEVFDFKNVDEILMVMAQIAKQTFLVLEKAWQIAGRRLVDYKVEFGVPVDFWTEMIVPAEIRLADVIDNDSWRVLQDGKYIDKQVYRDGGADVLDEMMAKYRLVARLTCGFGLPRQRIVIWTGSPKDDPQGFYPSDKVKDLPGFPQIKEVCLSGHKQPLQALQELVELLQEVPDTVIVVYVGRSDGLGSILAAASTAPVIAVPSTAREFPEDVWSSLRMPSQVPLMTVLEPSNACLAALNILAGRNPALYAHLRSYLEEKQQNILVF